MNKFFLLWFIAFNDAFGTEICSGRFSNWCFEIGLWLATHYRFQKGSDLICQECHQASINLKTLLSVTWVWAKRDEMTLPWKHTTDPFVWGFLNKNRLRVANKIWSSNVWMVATNKRYTIFGEYQNAFVFEFKGWYYHFSNLRKNHCFKYWSKI